MTKTEILEKIEAIKRNFTGPFGRNERLIPLVRQLARMEGDDYRVAVSSNARFHGDDTAVRAMQRRLRVPSVED